MLPSPAEVPALPVIIAVNRAVREITFSHTSVTGLVNVGLLESTADLLAEPLVAAVLHFNALLPRAGPRPLITGELMLAAAAMAYLTQLSLTSGYAAACSPRRSTRGSSRTCSCFEWPRAISLSCAGGGAWGRDLPRLDQELHRSCSLAQVHQEVAGGPTRRRRG